MIQNMNPNIHINMVNTHGLRLKKDYIRLDFNYKKGCENLEDLDTLTDISKNLRVEARRVVKEEINDKVYKVRVYPCCYCWLFFFFLLFIIGLVGTYFMFPYNFLFTGLGMVCLMCFIVFVCLKSCRHSTFFQKASAEMLIQTGGEIILEPIIEMYLVYTKGRVRKRSRCVGILLRHKDSTMTVTVLNSKQ